MPRLAGLGSSSWTEGCVKGADLGVSKARTHEHLLFTRFVLAALPPEHFLACH
jgi:hypothetical protein